MVTRMKLKLMIFKFVSMTRTSLIQYPKLANYYTHTDETLHTYVLKYTFLSMTLPLKLASNVAGQTLHTLVLLCFQHNQF